MRGVLKNTSLLTIILSLCIIVFLMSVSAGFSAINKNIQNSYYQLKNTLREPRVSQQIVIARIDDASFEALGQFPFDRSVYARVLENLKDYNFASIGFDLLLLDKSTQLHDARFSRILEKESRVVLGASLDSEHKLYLPESLFLVGNTDYGFLAPLVNPSNKTVYSFTPKRNYDTSAQIEHFTLRILRKYYEYLYEDSYPDDGLYTPSGYYFSPLGILPLARSGSEEILIHYTPKDRFTQFSFSDLTDPEKLASLDKIYNFQDKILLIGPAAEGLKDEFFTPYGQEYGVYVHANILNTLLTKQFLTYFDTRLEWLLIFCIVILSVSINLSSRSVTVFLGNMLIIIFFWGIIPFAILFFTSLIFNFFFEIIFSLLLSIALTNLVKYVIEDQNKQKLSKALSEYVSSDVMEEVLHEKGEVYLDGVKKSLGIFFSDIEGFTKLSEKLSPEDLVRFLREYLSLMTESLMRFGAYVDKFEGDAVMALWGAFDDLKESHIDAMCEVALRQQADIRELSKKWGSILGQELHVRIGLHCGEAIIGNIGAIGKKMNFTALGDEVNLASRLEGVNKYYQTYICVSQEIVDKASKNYVFCELDSVRVQGRTTPVTIYELLGRMGELSPSLLDYKKDYERALVCYRAQRFSEAQEILVDLFEKGFGSAQTLLGRIVGLESSKLPKNWDGVWDIEGK